MTLEGWASSLARGVFVGTDDNPIDAKAAIFFISFVVVVVFIMLPVVMAVLLDSFVIATAQEENLIKRKRDRNLRLLPSPRNPSALDHSTLDTRHSTI
jgi:hypothetical protein